MKKNNKWFKRPEKPYFYIQFFAEDEEKIKTNKKEYGFENKDLENLKGIEKAVYKILCVIPQTRDDDKEIYYRFLIEQWSSEAKGKGYKYFEDFVFEIMISKEKRKEFNILPFKKVKSVKKKIQKKYEKLR